MAEIVVTHLLTWVGVGVTIPLFRTTPLLELDKYPNLGKQG